MKIEFKLLSICYNLAVYPKTEVLITRHSKKATAEDTSSYEGLSQAGVELAKQRAKDFANILEASEPAILLLLIGASEAPRTKSTSRIYGEELTEIFSQKPEENI